MNKLISLTMFLLLLLLAGCGGGGGGGASVSEFVIAENTTTYTTSSYAPLTSTATDKTQLTTITAFSSTPLITADIEPLFAEICPFKTGRGLQHVIPVDINADGRMDVILYMWCQPVEVAGTYYDGRTPNRLVALVQNSTGQFENKTKQIFGTDFPAIDGASDCYVSHDFNGDGIKDIVFSTKREDGRAASPPTEINASRLSALMSNGAGSYNIVLFGTPQWGECIWTLDNIRGDKDIFVSGRNNLQYTYTNNSWTLVQQVNFGANIGLTFFRKSSSNSPTRYVISPQNGYTDTTGIYYHEFINGQWVEWRGSFKFPASWAEVKNGTSTMKKVLMKVDNKDIVEAQYGGTCQIRRTPNSTANEAIVLLTGFEVVGGYTGQILENYNQYAFNSLMLFEITDTGNLERRQLMVKNEMTGPIYPNRISCEDINGDGFEDIVLFNTNFNNSNQVTVYLNDQNGGFTRMNPDIFPPSPSEFGHLRNYIFADLNADGINDLVYFQIVGDYRLENRLRIHLGNRKINQSDSI